MWDEYLEKLTIEAKKRSDAYNSLTKNNTIQLICELLKLSTALFWRLIVIAFDGICSNLFCSCVTVDVLLKHPETKYYCKLEEKELFLYSRRLVNQDGVSRQRCVFNCYVCPVIHLEETNNVSLNCVRDKRASLYSTGQILSTRATYPYGSPTEIIAKTAQIHWLLLIFVIFSNEWLIWL